MEIEFELPLNCKNCNREFIDGENIVRVNNDSYFCESQCFLNEVRAIGGKAQLTFGQIKYISTSSKK